MLERLLVVGLGSIGRRHARIVHEIFPDVQIVALRRRGKSEPVPPEVGGCVMSLEEALEFRPQAAVVANPASSHLDVALPLAEAGIHLLIEKPISHTSCGVAELIALCEARGLTLITGYNLRYLPSLQRFSNLLREDVVGRVMSVRAEVGQFLPSWRPETDYRQTVSAQASLGGGVLLELSHEIHYLRWLFGEVDWVSATTARQSRLEVDVEDTAHMVIGFVSKAGEVPVIAALNMDFIRRDSTRTCSVIGETGTLRWNAVAGTVEIFGESADGWQALFTAEDQRDTSYVAEWQDFLTCMESGASPRVSGHDGLAVLGVIEAARQSADAGAVIHLPTDVSAALDSPVAK